MLGTYSYALIFLHIYNYFHIYVHTHTHAHTHTHICIYRYKSTGLIRWEGGWSSADGWDALDWAKDQNNEGCIKLIEIRLSQLQGVKYTNNTSGICSLFSKGRGQTELVECLAYYKPEFTSKLKDFVPNPWFTWKKEEEFPPDFVYPPIPRRHYCF